ncbi:MAG: hypothetical protein IJM44_00310 [Ruminococcus sp.]|nr:hypothetical protein [Ruminococcus sp.]
MAALISERFAAWEKECDERFERLRANESEINRIAARAYGLEGEVTIVPEDRQISVRRADLSRELRSLLSYAVGCMFGRYSLGEEGLIFAGGGFDITRYKRFVPAENGVIFVTEDDIMPRLRDFLAAAYGEETVPDNLRYIEENLGRECLSYLRGEFFRDHCTVYKKRPIYWLVSSGRRGALRALTYIHRFGEAELGILAEETERLLMCESRKGYIQELCDFRDHLAGLVSCGAEIVPDDGVAANYRRFSAILARAPF